MGLLDDLITSSGSETPEDPLARMASEMVLGQGEQRPPPKNWLEALSNVAGVLPMPGGNIPTGALAGISLSGFRGMGKELAKDVISYLRRFPDVSKTIAQNPKGLDIIESFDLPSSLGGKFEELNRLLDRITMAGRKHPVSGKRYPTLDEILQHEVEHTRTLGRIEEMEPSQAGLMGGLLREELPQFGAGSLDLRLQEFGNWLADLQPLSKGTKTGLKPLPMPKGTPPITPPIVLPSSTPKGIRDILDDLQRKIGSEGLSHLSERTVYPDTPLKLQDLAKQLNVGVKAGAPTAGAGTLMDDVLEALSQLRVQ
mgnify:FL=1